MNAAVPDTEKPGHIALVGGGPAGLVLAIALARRGIRTTVFERDAHPEAMPRFNPDRSYTIDISGHGLKAIRHIEAAPYFDERLIRFKGLKLPGGTHRGVDAAGLDGLARRHRPRAHGAPRRNAAGRVDIRVRDAG